MTSYLRVLLVGTFLAWALPSIHADECPSATQEAERLARFEFLQIRMAIPVRITVYAAEESTANLAAERAYARFKQLDRLLSDYDPDSELSQLCEMSRPGQPVRVSNELFTVLQHARVVSQQSAGAFDVTIGPVTDLWRKVRRRKVLPSDEERQAALRRVDWSKVVLSADRQTVELQMEDMQLDLGGIAKGYAADEALRVMAELGITRALVDAGGDVVVAEPAPGKNGWLIGIAPLDAPRGEPERFVTLSNASVATSGDASQHVEIDGVRYSHIVDPRTGMGVTTPSSVTVIARDGITADGLASAVSVLGPERGLALIEQIEGAEVYIVIRDNQKNVSVHTSSGMDELLVDRADRRP